MPCSSETFVSTRTVQHRLLGFLLDSSYLRPKYLLLQHVGAHVAGITRSKSKAWMPLWLGLTAFLAVCSLVCRQPFLHLAVQWADQRSATGRGTSTTIRMIVLSRSGPQPLRCCLSPCFWVLCSSSESFKKQERVVWPLHYRRWYRPPQCPWILLVPRSLRLLLTQTNLLYNICRVRRCGTHVEIAFLQFFIFVYLFLLFSKMGSSPCPLSFRCLRFQKPPPCTEPPSSFALVTS